MTKKEKLKLEERAKKYKCNGICYWATGMCPLVETCPETKDKEWRAALYTLLVIGLVPIGIVIGIILALFNLI